MTDFIDITEENRDDYNKVVNHPLQTYEWGEFREKTNVKVIRRGRVQNNKIIDGFTVTIHPIPKIGLTIGYVPKGNKPTKGIIEELKRIGKVEKCIFIQLEPNVILNQESGIKNQEVEKYFQTIIHDSKFMIHPSYHPLFTKYTFTLDLTLSEDELLKNMHPKTRYNIRVAEKHNVKVIEDDSEAAFKKYLELTHETTTRQKFYAHTPSYHKKMWETLKGKSIKGKGESNELSAHLFVAYYTPDTSPLTLHPLPLVTWILFVFHNTLYYPYGASSSEHRNVMASNLIMWEAIKFGKKLGLTSFDMWGALGPEPNAKDPWYGFHKFKQGYGATLTEFVGSYDLVINPVLYQGYKVADKLRWMMLRIKK